MTMREIIRVRRDVCRKRCRMRRVKKNAINLLLQNITKPINARYKHTSLTAAAVPTMH